MFHEWCVAMCFLCGALLYVSCVVLLLVWSGVLQCGVLACVVVVVYSVGVSK